MNLTLHLRLCVPGNQFKNQFQASKKLPFSTETFRVTSNLVKKLYHFQVFTFPMISGDPKTALREPFSIILTETSAKKLFGDADPLGKTIIRPGDKEDQEYVVTGIIKDVPIFSHMKFDMLASLSTRKI